MANIEELKIAGSLGKGAYDDLVARGLYQAAGAVHGALLALNAAIKALEPATPAQHEETHE